MKYDDERFGSGGAGGPNSKSTMRAEERWFPVCRVCHKPAVRKITGPSGRRNFYCGRCEPLSLERRAMLTPLALRDAIRPSLPPEAAPVVPHKQNGKPAILQTEKSRSPDFGGMKDHPEIADTGSAMYRVKRALDDLAHENGKLREHVAALEQRNAQLEAQVKGWEDMADQLTRPEGRGESA